MDKRIVICIIIILVVGIAIFLFFHYYEIVQREIDVLPSKEFYSNDYLALERWFKEIGIPVTRHNRIDLHDKTSGQKTILLTHSQNGILGKSKEEIMYIIINYKNVIICLSNILNEDLDMNIIEFLSDFGITVGSTPNYHAYSDEDTPDYHWRIKFTVEDGKDYILNYDIHNNIRIIRIPLDDGVLTIMGLPSFMWNWGIEKEANARLVWELLGEPSDENGIIIVQNYREPHVRNSLFGALMQRGNIVPVLVSAALLIIFGFWMVIPLFGQVKEEKQRSTRPIKERFAAEISFLKKYKGLYYYDEVIKKIRGEQ